MEPNVTHQLYIVPQYRYFGLCPDCLCDYGCVRRGDCCPDVFFRFPKQQCVNRTIIQGRPVFLHDMYDKQFSELMVTTCPDGSEQRIREKCEGKFDTYGRLQNFPVTSKDHFALTYFNKYCAQCHGVKEILTWNLDIDCFEFADFNFLSNLDKIIKLAYDRQCILQAYISERDLPIKVNPEVCYESISQENKRLYTKCNETGLWRKFDPSFQYACESRYHMEYRVFKNIFCYMCNPSIHKDYGIIDLCNVTGQWDSFDEDLRQACTELPENQATMPFKNIFCYLCNIKMNKTGLFEDVHASLIEYAISHHHFRIIYLLTIDAFDMNHFMHTLNIKLDKNSELKTPVIRHFSVDTLINKDSTVNISNILHFQLSMFSDYFGVCKARSSLFATNLHISSFCTCDASCVFHEFNCCADLLIEQRTRCISEEEISTFEGANDEVEGYLVINGCLQERTYKVYEQFCSVMDWGDTYSILPLNIAGTDVSFNNLYCAMCNLESETYVEQMQGVNITSKNHSTDPLSPIYDFMSSTNSYEAWNMDIVCPLYLDYSHYHNLGWLLETARTMKCIIEYKTSVRRSSKCSFTHGFNDNCANFVNWTYMNTDIEWACKNVASYEWYPSLEMEDPPSDNFDVSWYKHYRDSDRHAGKDTQRSLTYSTPYSNIFCGVCKPVTTFEIHFIENCNATGFWKDYDDALEFGCLYLPRVFYFYPFKNGYCAKCNGMSLTAMKSGNRGRELPVYEPIFGVTWFPILRNLFSMSEDVEYMHGSNEAVCSSRQQFDEYTVRHDYSVL